MAIACVVTIVTPPEDTTVCRGSMVNISCGYQSDTAWPVRWFINGTMSIPDTALSSNMYQVNNRDDPLNYSLTLLRVDYNTTLQCIVESEPNITTSAYGTVAVIEPIVMIAEAVGGCGYVFVSWTDNSSEICNNNFYDVELLNQVHNPKTQGVHTGDMRVNFTEQPHDTLFNITLNTFAPPSNTPTSNVDYTSVRTLALKGPIPAMVTANVTFNNSTVVITVSWQAPVINNSCTVDVNVTMYNITVMYQNSQATVTVPADTFSAEVIDTTVIVPNREYTITVSAISDQGTSYPSDPVVVSTNTGGTDNGGGSSAGAIAGGVTAGIIAVITAFAFI